MVSCCHFLWFVILLIAILLQQGWSARLQMLTLDTLGMFSDTMNTQLFSFGTQSKSTVKVHNEYNEN